MPAYGPADKEIIRIIIIVCAIFFGIGATVGGMLVWLLM